MTKPLGLTTQAVGAVLKRGGLSRSESHATRIRGYRSTTTGFKVKKPVVGDAIAMVEYVGKTFGADASTEKQMLLRIDELLTQAGYRTARSDYAGYEMADGPYVSVYAPEA